MSAPGARARPFDTVSLLRGALATALIAVLAQAAVPLPSGVPVTLQTFAVALAGFCQRPRGALLSIAAYLLLGLAGAPVFAARYRRSGHFDQSSRGLLNYSPGPYHWTEDPSAILAFS